MSALCLKAIVTLSVICSSVIAGSETPGSDIQVPVDAVLVSTGAYESKLYKISAATDSYNDDLLLLDLHGSTSYAQGFDVGYLLGEQYVKNWNNLMVALLGDEWWEPAVARIANAFLDEQWNDFLSKDVPTEYIEEMSGMTQGGKSSKGHTGNNDIGVIAARGVVMANFPSTLSNFKLIFEDEQANPPTTSIMNDPDFLRVFAIMEKNWLGLHCSNWGAWGSRTADGQVFTGRNLDWVSDTGVAEYKLVTIHRPPEGYAHASFGFAGVYGALTGMSSQGLTVHEANLESNDVSFRGFPWIIRVREVMAYAKNIDEALTIWNSTTNTLGFNHGFGSKEDGRAVLLETMHNNTAVFGDNDPREQDLIVDGQQIGDPRVDAVYRTNHGYDDYSVEHFAWNNTGAYTDSIVRYQMFPPAFDAYESASIAITGVEAVNITALVAGRGTNPAHPYNCEAPHDDASNVLSVAFEPNTLTAYAAWENGSGESWVPAACNTYLALDLSQWF